MANFQYTSDIVADALFRAGEPTNGTSDFHSQAFSYLNNLYMQICRGGAELAPGVSEDWHWLRKPSPGTILLQPPITTLTATVNLGATSVTLSGNPQNYLASNISVANWFFRVDNHPDIFKVSAHTSGTATLTLDGVYTGANVSAGACTLFLSDYNLATDVLRIVAPMRVYRTAGYSDRNSYKIYQAELDVIEESYPLAYMEQGIPDQYAFIGETTAGTKRIRFNRCGGGTGSATTVYRIEYEYLIVPTALTSPGTSEEPLVPREWRPLMADALLAYLFGIKNDDRAGAIAQTVAAGLRGMKNENRYKKTTSTDSFFSVRPRTSGPWSRHRLPKRTESGAIIG